MVFKNKKLKNLLFPIFKLKFKNVCFYIDSAPEGTDLSFTKSFAAVLRKLKKKREATPVETMGQTSLFSEFTVFSFIMF